MKTVVSPKLNVNEAWFRNRCEGCDDIKIRPMQLGDKGQVSCLAVYVEAAVSNLMLEESMLGRLINQLRDIP